MIDFYDNRFVVICEHDIKSQDMKAHIPLILLRLAILILMPDRWQSADNRLNYGIFNARFEGFHINPIF